MPVQVPARRVVFEGHDGAAKTPLVEAVRAVLARSMRVYVCAPFTEINARLGRDVYEDWTKSPEAARDALNAITACIHTAADQDVDVVLYDRHWMTVLRCLDISVLPREDIAALRKTWIACAPPTFFCHATPETTRTRATFTRETAYHRTDALIDADYTRRLDLAWTAKHGVILGNIEVGPNPVSFDDFVYDICTKLEATWTI